MTRRARVLSWTFLASTACTCEQAYVPAPSAKAPVAEAPVADAPVIDDAKAPPAPEPLTEEDKRLIAADPKSLTPEDRRKRAYALRRKIMQNPDSPAARTLEDLRRAHEAGELQVPNNGQIRFEARGKDGPPAGGMPPAGSRPAAPSDP